MNAVGGEYGDDDGDADAQDSHVDRIQEGFDEARAIQQRQEVIGDGLEEQLGRQGEGIALRLERHAQQPDDGEEREQNRRQRNQISQQPLELVAPCIQHG